MAATGELATICSRRELRRLSSLAGRGKIMAAAKIPQAIGPETVDYPGDSPCTVSLSQAERLGTGFRSYDRFVISRPERTGQGASFEREVLRSGIVVGVLPVDF